MLISWSHGEDGEGGKEEAKEATISTVHGY